MARNNEIALARKIGMSVKMRCLAPSVGGAPCQRWAMQNGRCSSHGGKTKGVKLAIDNDFARKYGIYARHLSEYDQALIRDMDLSNVDDEIRILKIQLDRTVKIQAELDAADLTIDQAGNPILALGIVNRIETRIGKNGADDVVSVIRERRDFTRDILALTRRIQQLTVVRVVILGGDEGRGEFFEEAKRLTPEARTERIAELQAVLMIKV